MLESLRVQNLGLIQRTEIEFQPGFTAITGETGAGKTMLLNSVALLLGAKAEPSMVRAGATTAVVEGSFALSAQAPARQVVEAAGGFIEDDLVEAGRVVPAAGRSKAQLGGRTVPAAVLGEFGSSLVSVHGQAQQWRLKDMAAQLQALDAYGDEAHQQARQAFQQAYETHRGLQRELRQWEDSQAQRRAQRAELEAHSELLAELEPQSGEFAELGAAIARLSNVEALREQVGRAHEILRPADDDYPGLVDGASTAAKALEGAAAEDASLGAAAQSLRESSYVLADLAGELASYLDNLNADPLALEQHLARRAALVNAAARLGCEPEDLAAKALEVGQALAGLGQADNRGEELAVEVAQAQAHLEACAQVLTVQRQASAQALAAAVSAELHDLSMAAATFSVALKPGEIGPHGAESVEFQLSPHHSVDPLPLASSASGGELSRVMLALELSLAQRAHKSDQTFIFDEIDAGVGGQAGVEVGRRLAALAQSAQVIVVTHLAQVAAYAGQQVLVEKDSDLGQTTLRTLKTEERLEELARMLSGDLRSNTALEHAAELLKAANVRQS